MLTAWLPTPPPLAGTSSTLPTHGATNARETAKKLLTEAIRDVLGEEPPVVVHPQVKEGNAASQQGTELPSTMSARDRHRDGAAGWTVEEVAPLFEFLLPIFVGLYAICALLGG